MVTLIGVLVLVIFSLKMCVCVCIQKYVIWETGIMTPRASKDGPDPPDIGLGRSSILREEETQKMDLCSERLRLLFI